MKQALLGLIVLVFISTLVFAVLIWKQTINFEKKALAAKRLKEQYLLEHGLSEEESQVEKEDKSNFVGLGFWDVEEDETRTTR